MSQQFFFVLALISLILNLSNQSQPLRDLSGSTLQNFEAQASQWTLSDPSSTQHPISVTECLTDFLLMKPASLPTGTAITKTFNDLENHDLLHFYFTIHYFGEYTSQTVNIKFDQTSIETSKVLPLKYEINPSCAAGTFSGEIMYYGVVPHTSSSFAIEFSSNLHNTNLEVTWGLRDFSIATDFSEKPPESAAIHGYAWYQDVALESEICGFAEQYFSVEYGYCTPCDDPCKTCYGPGSDKCLTYKDSFPENRLCPEGQTLLIAGCTNCGLENCTLCDEDVNQCDTCLSTCGWCFDFLDPPQCQECTPESNFFLYEGSCIENCPPGTYGDSERKCQPCQPGCLDCTGPRDCLQCEASETTSINGLCVCNEPRMYFEEGLGCTGACSSGCEQCINSEECLICDSGLTVQENGDCRCDNDGFYYEEETGSCTGQCFEFCEYCHDATLCIACSDFRTPQGSMCKCKFPRVLIGNTCECSADMVENPDTLNCEYIELIDIAYQNLVSPLFDAILQVQMNPVRKWTDPPSITWTIDCSFQNLDTKDLFQTYLSNQNTDILLIPSSFLEYNFPCNVRTSYFNQNFIEISKDITFKTVTSSQPQVHIAGGPFQMLSHKEPNFILAQVKSSSTGKAISSSDLKITWAQTSGDDKLDMKKITSSSDPLKLSIPKCTLSRGKIYKFKLSVTMKSNNKETLQEVTIALYAPKIQTQIIGLTENYHLLSKSLTLESQLFVEEDDECLQKTLLSDLINPPTAMYTWECFYLDLDTFPTPAYRLLDESGKITNDHSVILHPDPQNLFYQSTSSSTLTIPSSYFTSYQNYQFLFYLTVTVQSKSPAPSIPKFTLQQPSLYTSKNKTHIRIASSKPFISTKSITCVSENNCQAFSPADDGSPTKFISNSPYNPQYSYSWLLNSLDPRPYNTFLNIVLMNSWDLSIVPQILFQITDKNNNVASAFFTLPWSTPPQGGSINVYPLEGEAYNTKFLISTYGWADIDLPVSYQFYTSYDPGQSIPVKEKMIKTLNPYDETILVPPVQVFFAYCYVGVIVKDNLQATSESYSMVFLSGEAQDYCEVIEKSSQALRTSKKSDNLFQRFRLISVLLENLSSQWESRAWDSPCIDKGSEFKFTAVTEMKEIVQALESKEDFKIAMLNNIVFSSNVDFNQNRNWNLYDHLVDSYYFSLASSSVSILPSEEYKALFSWIDNLLWIMKTPNSSIKEDPDKILLYINLFLRSTLSNYILPTDEYISYKGNFYTYHTVKTTYCKVLSDQFIWISYAEYDLLANITLRADQSIPPEKCNDQLDLIFMAFRPNATVIPWTEDTFPQTILYFDLVDSLTKKSFLDIYAYFLHSPIPFCPVEWNVILCRNTSGGTEIYGIFELRNQINKIFAKSNIDQIKNISALAHFKFWKSVAFWTVLTFSIGFLLSFYWLYVKHPTYCALIAHKTITTERLLKKLNLFFWVIHPLVGIYIYNDAKTKKPVKLAIYHQRLVLVMMFSTIFSTIEKGEGRVFKTYILLFNTLTVTPVNALLSRIFQKLFSIKNPKKKITSKIQLFIGILCYLLLLIGCFLAMFIIEAQIEESQNKEWALNFLISFFQDLSLSPAISIFNKICLIKLSESDRFGKTLTNSPKVLALLLPETFMSIYKAIFAPTPVTINIENVKETGQSPRTLTTSPLSSNRKFLKFTTLDLNSQTSSRVQTPSELRTRVASENEIGSVDALPMETLIGNRFQTLFSEGKIEMIKQGSPTKENFKKLQSIYSKNSILTIPKISRIKQKTEAKPVTSIEFNPLKPVEVSFGDIWSFEEQLEEINPMDSPVKDSFGDSPPVGEGTTIKKEDLFKEK